MVSGLQMGSAPSLEREAEEKTMGRLSGKVAIITGAAGGQGEAEARLFVAEGARVAMTDIQERGKQVAAELGDAALFLHHDVSDSAAWTRVVSETLRRFGKLDASSITQRCSIQRPSSTPARPNWSSIFA
jgi:short-subunit dehydrogenase involved in D-alanine esterification of teichoic acids